MQPDTKDQISVSVSKCSLFRAISLIKVIVWCHRAVEEDFVHAYCVRFKTFAYNQGYITTLKTFKIFRVFFLSVYTHFVSLLNKMFSNVTTCLLWRR